jgi:ribose-phosphate pyrophosphokinase
MELLIMISACKGGSAKSITAVMPYFPYSRQSKKKQHRGAITARMIANLLHIAGVNHVITLDLHASQMQGFFKCPVDNLVAEPLLARWIRLNVPNWREAVVVSKNPGGTKRVTSLADALKLSFGIVTTDRRRAGQAVQWNESAMFEQLRLDDGYGPPALPEPAMDPEAEITPISRIAHEPNKPQPWVRTLSHGLPRKSNSLSESTSSPLSKSMRASSIIEPEVPLAPLRTNVDYVQEESQDHSADESAEEYTDEVSLPTCASYNTLTVLSAPKTLSTAVSCRDTSSTIHIRPQPYQRLHTPLGAAGHPPRATRTCPRP